MFLYLSPFLLLFLYPSLSFSLHPSFLLYLEEQMTWNLFRWKIGFRILEETLPIDKCVRETITGWNNAQAHGTRISRQWIWLWPKAPNNMDQRKCITHCSHGHTFYGRSSTLHPWMNGCIRTSAFTIFGCMLLDDDAWARRQSSVGRRWKVENDDGCRVCWCGSFTFIECFLCVCRCFMFITHQTLWMLMQQHSDGSRYDTIRKIFLHLSSHSATMLPHIAIRKFSSKTSKTCHTQYAPARPPALAQTLHICTRRTRCAFDWIKPLSEQ